MEISYTRQPTVTTDKNGFTEDQQTQYITQTAKALVQKERVVQEETLSQDKNWIDSARILYTMQEGSEAETPPDTELSKWALDYVGQIQYNLVSGANAAFEFQDADDMQKIAMRYAMETYDMKDITMEGVKRFAIGVATDPTTYIGLGTFGAGFTAKAAASTGAKKAFMKFLSKPSNLAAAEGAAYGAAESGVQQNIEVATGAREEVDLGEIAATAGIGAVAGKGLGAGVEYLGKKFSKKYVDEIGQEGEVIAKDIKANIGFAPELLGGSINGLNYDEETNEFSFDPMRFMEGFLGGHVAKKIATNPKLNAKAKKEALAYAQRLHDRLKDKPMFKYITGTHSVIDDTPGVAKNYRTNKLTDNKIYIIKPDDEFKGEITLLKNKEPAPDMGSRFGQDVEPTGYFAIQKEVNSMDSMPNYETVKADIKNPLIIDVSEDLIQWKRDLSEQYKAKKKTLTNKLKKAGYDSIITTDKEGNTGEIIILDTSIIKNNK